MLLFLISFIEWAKLIVGVALISFGGLIFIKLFINWVVIAIIRTDFVQKANFWWLQAGLVITCLLFFMSGFYIAGW